MKSLSAGILFSGMTLIATCAQAGIITTYNDKATFLGDTSGSSLTGTIPNSGNVGTSTTLGDVTFSTTAYSTTTNMYFGHWSTLIPGNEIAISGSENMDIAINLSTTVQAFGFDFHEPTAINTAINGTNTPYAHESIFTVSLFDGASLIDSATFDPVSEQLEFFGFLSDTSFDTVKITESLAGVTYGSGFDISNDNEFFGEFYAGTQPVPVPATALMLLAGLGGLVYSRKKTSR